MTDPLGNIVKTIERIADSLQHLSRRVRDLEVRPRFSSSELYIEGDIYTNAFTYYYPDAAITGWSSLTVSDLYYKRVGNTVKMYVFLDGTSNSPAISFSVPFEPVSGVLFGGPIASINSGIAVSGGVYLLQETAPSSSVNCYTTVLYAGWTAGGRKSVRFQFEYEAA